MNYINLETGEVLTRAEMLKQFREEYDGDDPTNGLSWDEYYIREDEYYAKRLH